MTVVKQRGRGDFGAADIKIGGKKHSHDPPLLLRGRKNGNRTPMKSASLHHHTTFSYLDGSQLPEAHVRRAVELQLPSIAFTEHGNIDSHVKAEAACEGTGVKPLFGCEVYMPVTSVNKEGVEVPWDSPDALTQRKHHLTLIAKNAQGYLNLLELVTRSWLDFYYEATVTWDNLVKHKEGLIVLSGCQGSLLFCSTVGGKGIEEKDASYQRGLAVARRFAREFEDYYIEVQAFPELEKSCRFNPIAARLSRAVRRPLVGTLDCHYTTVEESELQQILHNLRPGEKRTLEEQAREWGYNVPLCPPLNDNSFYRKLRATGLDRASAREALVSTAEIAEAATVALPKLPMVRFPVPEGYANVIEYWRARIAEGWKARGIDRKSPEERRRYKKQLRHEMKLIESKDFVDYFMLVSAGVTFIKGLKIPVGPARGSAAASVAAFLLGITEVDPLRPEFLGLLRFERFIDVTRLDLPDIDLDFPSEARPMLRDFYTAMFGEGCVNNVGTWTKFKGKNSLDDVARVFNVPRFEVATLKDFLIERSSGDLRASSTIEDTIEQFPKAREVWERYPELAKGSLLEGNLKGFGVHAAALVLSNQPITTVTAVVEREVPKGSGNIVQVVALDKYDAERQGLVKMDFLGLNTMTMIWDCIKRLGWTIERLYGLPLDDEKVYDLLRATDVTGVFQFEGRSQRYVCSILRPDRFSEIMDCGALCRPGPLHNGAAREYAHIKHGGKLPESLHPALDAITAPTQYQMVYQEQMLTIARVIGNFDDVGVARIRKIIALKKGEQEFNRNREEFMKGAASLHKRFPEYPPMNEGTAEKIWGNMITSGAYAFNAAHCAAYGLISYYTAYFKVYHPAVFYAAALAESAGDKERTRQLLRDAEKHDVRVRLPSVSRSEANWSPVRPYGKKVIRAGFRQVDGIGEKTAGLVADERTRLGMSKWGDLTSIRGIGPKTIDKIEGWLKGSDPFGAFKMLEDIEAVTADLHAGRLLGPEGKPLPRPTHNAADLAAEENQGKHLQVVWLGTAVKRNIRDIFEQNRARGNELDPKAVKDAHLNEWVLLTGEDASDQLLITIDRWRYPAMKEAVFNFRMGHDLLLVKAVKPGRSTVRKINVKQLWVISPDDD